MGNFLTSGERISFLKRTPYLTMKNHLTNRYTQFRELKGVYSENHTQIQTRSHTHTHTHRVSGDITEFFNIKVGSA